MSKLSSKVQSWLGAYWASFSYVGLAVATLFFAASLTPSLLPRHFLTQGLLSGFAIAVGYGFGLLFVWFWNYLEMPKPSAATERLSKRITTVVVLFVACYFLWFDAVWQNSIRELMEMTPVASAYRWNVAWIACITGALLVAVARLVGRCWLFVHRRVTRVVPRRVSYAVTTLVIGLALMFLVNDVCVRLALDAADAIFLELDNAVDEGIEPPTDETGSGSTASLIDWDTIGRQGKRFIVGGPGQDDIREFWKTDVLPPLRVYVGYGTDETAYERAALALDELKRVGGFDRSLLVVATPTGTGWLDPGAVDTLEYLHAGDTAIVSMQYSYLPSWISILADPNRSRDSATVLFDEIYGYWKTLPRDERPKLYLHGLSLGALGSAASADLFTVFEDPIHGGVWSGPPFPSQVWRRATRYRNPDSPMWLPKFRDGSMMRYTAQKNTLVDPDLRWGPMRFVFVQYASDPMTFFAPELLYRRPDWLVGERGPDVSPYLRWMPVVTFLQVGFDLPMATSVPTGYGHNMSPSSYIDAWIAVTEPPNWNDEMTRRLKELFVE